MCDLARFTHGCNISGALVSELWCYFMINWSCTLPGYFFCCKVVSVLPCFPGGQDRYYPGRDRDSLGHPASELERANASSPGLCCADCDSLGYFGYF